MTGNYYVIGEQLFEVYRNSVRGEAEMRGRIQVLTQDNPDIKLHIIYGDEITDRIIFCGEES